MEVQATNNQPDKLMVMMHGLGSDEHDLIALAPLFQKELPEYHFFSPNGLEPYDMSTFGRQWFSVRDRSPEVLLHKIEENTDAILEVIKGKQRQLSLQNKDTVLVGFSQGAMVATYINLIQNEPFLGVVSFSGKLITPKTLINTQTPFCIIHGKEDVVLDSEESCTMSKYLKENNIENQLLIVDNLNHSIDSAGIEFSKNFILNCKIV